jgi:hypothetical protein
VGRERSHPSLGSATAASAPPLANCAKVSFTGASSRSSEAGLPLVGSQRTPPLLGARLNFESSAAPLAVFAGARGCSSIGIADERTIGLVSTYWIN